MIEPASAALPPAGRAGGRSQSAGASARRARPGTRLPFITTLASTRIIKLIN